MKASCEWKIQAACHTAQDITWMHAADKNMNCVQQHKTHVDRRVRGWANPRPHTHSTRQNMERECPKPVTKPKLKTWVPRSEHHAPTRNKARRRESTRLEHTQSEQDMTGVSGLCHKTMNNTRLKWQPWQFGALWNWIILQCNGFTGSEFRKVLLHPSLCAFHYKRCQNVKLNSSFKQFLLVNSLK